MMPARNRNHSNPTFDPATWGRNPALIREIDVDEASWEELNFMTEPIYADAMREHVFSDEEALQRHLEEGRDRRKMHREDRKFERGLADEMPNEERALQYDDLRNAIGDEYANMAANAELSRGRAHDGAAYNMSQGFGRYQRDMPLPDHGDDPFNATAAPTTLVEEPDPRASVYVDDDGDEVDPALEQEAYDEEAVHDDEDPDNQCSYD